MASARSSSRRAIAVSGQNNVGSTWSGADKGMALVAGIAGSFVGGLLASLLAGDGVDLRPSGIIGSLIGAVIVTAVWQWFRKRRTA